MLVVHQIVTPSRSAVMFSLLLPTCEPVHVLRQHSAHLIFVTSRQEVNQVGVAQVVGRVDKGTFRRHRSLSFPQRP